MMWLNWSVATINATLQLLDIYRLYAKHNFFFLIMKIYCCWYVGTINHGIRMQNALKWRIHRLYISVCVYIYVCVQAHACACVCVPPSFVAQLVDISWYFKWRHTWFKLSFPNNAKWSNLLHFVAKTSFLFREITLYYS